MANGPVLRTIRPGDTSKADPLTIVVVANPVLESPMQSGNFVDDPIIADPHSFDVAVNYIDQALFGGLPNQSERFLGEPTIAPAIKLVSLFVSGLPSEDANALVSEHNTSNLLVARRAVFVPFLAHYGLQADVAYAVSQSASHDRASAWFTTDDDARPGVPFTFDGNNYVHRFYNLIPGTVAIHSTSKSLTALHEFGHALSSYSNGSVVDLYVDSVAGLNNKRLRPIPDKFADYDGITTTSDASRDHLGYPPTWQSYHCELVAPFPAVMDNYWQSADGVPEHCQHDRITQKFLLDRVRAKLAR